METNILHDLSTRINCARQTNNNVSSPAQLWISTWAQRKRIEKVNLVVHKIHRLAQRTPLHVHVVPLPGEEVPQQVVHRGHELVEGAFAALPVVPRGYTGVAPGVRASEGVGAAAARSLVVVSVVGSGDATARGGTAVFLEAGGRVGFGGVGDAFEGGEFFVAGPFAGFGGRAHGPLGGGARQGVRDGGRHRYTVVVVGRVGRSVGRFGGGGGGSDRGCSREAVLRDVRVLKGVGKRRASSS